MSYKVKGKMVLDNKKKPLDLRGGGSFLGVSFMFCRLLKTLQGGYSLCWSSDVPRLASIGAVCRNL